MTGKNRSPNHKLLFQLQPTPAAWESSAEDCLSDCLLEVGKNAKLVVEHDAKVVVVVFFFFIWCQLHNFFFAPFSEDCKRHLASSTFQLYISKWTTVISPASNCLCM